MMLDAGCWILDAGCWMYEVNVGCAKEMFDIKYLI